jgi:hypothetical protein
MAPMAVILGLMHHLLDQQPLEQKAVARLFNLLRAAKAGRLLQASAR